MGDKSPKAKDKAKKQGAVEKTRKKTEADAKARPPESGLGGGKKAK
jgi:hypothetical protein